MLSYSSNIDETRSHKSDSKIPDIQRPAARMIRTQLIIAVVLGLLNFTMFCFLRKKFPKLYCARILKRSGLPYIPKNSLFKWVKVVVHDINEKQILEHAGLDAFVFLNFFKMAIKILAACSFFGFFVISPIRYHYTGGYDQGDDLKRSAGNGGANSPEEYEGYLWMYVVFTYTFTIAIVWTLYRQTNHVLSVRQEYLGKQNSITDRTIKLSGIPPDLRNEIKLAKHIESLNIGKVFSVVICREWKPLNKLFDQRKKKLQQLEKQWSAYLTQLDINLKKDFSFQGLDNGIFALKKSINEPYIDEAVDYPSTIEHIINGLSNGANYGNDENDDFDEESELLNRRVTYSNSIHNIDDANSTISAGVINLAQSQLELKRPKIRIGWLRPKKVDAINYLTDQLNSIDSQIRKSRLEYYSPTPTAFITMESVASAQMMAQAVLDPHANFLTTELAPAPHDVLWGNVCLSRKERLAKSYHITIIICIISIALIFPVTYLAALLNTKTISKFFPELGEFLKNHKLVKNFVTGLLPTYIFTLLNVIIPFLFVLLSSKQGFVSHGEQELSSVSKNFFYLFVNMFLVFTLAGTASNYWSFLSDTTKIAKQLATSLRDLSLFYVDLIIFQGLGMFPFKLLLFGATFKFPFFYSSCTTPREFKTLYNPPIFNFGLALPQPLLILIITIIYSVMSTKILISGLVYFIIGYYVYKYQLMYSMVHPPHSTGKVWPMVFRRIILGLLIFQLTMAGLLALQNGFILAISLTPLPFITFGFLYDFQKHFAPLSYFIALRSINQNDSLESQSRYSETPETLASESSDNDKHGKASIEPGTIQDVISENEDFGIASSDLGHNILEQNASFSSEFLSSTDSNRFDFSRNQKKSNHFGKSNAYPHLKSVSRAPMGEKTLDEIREKNSTYEYPYLIQCLDGPWIAFDGNEIVMLNDGITTHKKIEFFEWE
ncbi:Csc1 protein [Saccharomycopsis crataegensis]|uniref:Csc1 protein n=1 Tax=Saccharomycopsis crataegensis TaxID=43959 RepID=A0AAV5QGB0_9ASCO|nr:Csc1 protein [Saccharomycopsis crataegensis]